MIHVSCVRMLLASTVKSKGSHLFIMVTPVSLNCNAPALLNAATCLRKYMYSGQNMPSYPRLLHSSFFCIRGGKKRSEEACGTMLLAPR